MHQKFLMTAFVFFLMFEFTGCSLTYRSPIDGPTATLSERDPSLTGVAIFAEPIECKGGPHPLHSFFSTEKMKGITIAANQPVTLRATIYGTMDADAIYNNITFIPQAGKHYTVDSKRINSTRPIYQLRILRIDYLKDGKKRYIPIRYVKRAIGAFSACSDKRMQAILKRISNN